MSDWNNLPELRNDELIFQDTSITPLPGKIVPCLLCTKPFLMRHYTGEPDQICGSCWDEYQDTARLICAKCRVTVCRVKPTVLDNGYYIRPKSVLHLNACNICEPGIPKSTVIEISEWERTTRQHKPTIIVPPGYNH
jgi:hypothetical protein